MKEITCFNNLIQISAGKNNLAGLSDEQAINCYHAAKDYGTLGFFLGFAGASAGAYMIGIKGGALSIIGFVGGVTGSIYATNYCYDQAAVCSPDSGFYDN